MEVAIIIVIFKLLHMNKFDELNSKKRYSMFLKEPGMASFIFLNIKQGQIIV